MSKEDATEIADLKKEFGEDKVSRFMECDTWEQAVQMSTNGLPPLAIKLLYTGDLPEINAPLALGDNHYNFSLVCMTTSFQEEVSNGKLGWMHLEVEPRQILSDLMFKHQVINEWAYMAQIQE